MPTNPRSQAQLERNAALSPEQRRAQTAAAAAANRKMKNGVRVSLGSTTLEADIAAKLSQESNKAGLIRRLLEAHYKNESD